MNRIKGFVAAEDTRKSDFAVGAEGKVKCLYLELHRIYVKNIKYRHKMMNNYIYRYKMVSKYKWKEIKMR